MEDVAALQEETPVTTAAVTAAKTAATAAKTTATAAKTAAAVTAAVLYFEHITNCVPTRNLI